MPSYITNANLAQQVSDLLAKWQTRETQMQAWIGGTATGGPFANGTYPLTDVLSNTVYTPSPAALVSGVGVSVASAAAQAAAAAASATSAASSATGAAASASTATTQATAAATSNTAAGVHDTNCASLQALAQTSANAALASQIAAAASAAAAVVSAAAALASQTAAAGSATAAAASATSAAASAVLAATFVPALYALLAGATFTGALVGTSAFFSGNLGSSSPISSSSTSSFVAVVPAATQINALTIQQGSQPQWIIYQPASSGDLHIFGNSADRCVLTATGVLTAANLSGTNTGDQNLAPYAPLAGANFTGPVTFSGLAEFALNIGALGALPITVSTGMGSIAWNETGGVGEVDFFNNFWTAGIAFNWYQQTAANSKTQLMTLSPAGALSLTSTVAASNFSGSSSGTNTGDQNLAPYALLAGATFTGAVSVGTGGTGKFSVLSTDAHISAGTSVWNSQWSVFGPNAASTTGASLGLGYDTTAGQAVIYALAPGVAWEPMLIGASKFTFSTAGATNAVLTNGLVLGAATGGDQGIGTLNATGYFINGVAFTGFTTGTFTGTYVGGTTAPTVTCSWTKVGNSVTLYIPVLTATSNTAGFSMSGLPGTITPATSKVVAGGSGNFTNNTTVVLAFASALSTGSIQFMQSLGANWTSAGTKASPAQTLTYDLT